MAKILLFLLSCLFINGQNHLVEPKKQFNCILNKQGTIVSTRFSAPAGFERPILDAGSFGYYLRSLPLKPDGALVKYYDGTEKPNNAYAAVVDMEISPKNLQQCADAVMRLRGEYFFSVKEYGKISFTLTNGFRADYSEWMKGKRVKVVGNKTSWIDSTKPSNTHKDFCEYMDFVFNYAGTLSLSKSLKSRSLKDISIGDVFIVGGSPGHAVIVIDICMNKQGEKLFMLAQSYMPAQETQILRNPNDHGISPWYSSKFDSNLITPQWTFTSDQLKTW
jgi:hypothetical protein